MVRRSGRRAKRLNPPLVLGERHPSVSAVMTASRRIGDLSISPSVWYWGHEVVGGGSWREEEMEEGGVGVGVGGGEEVGERDKRDLIVVITLVGYGTVNTVE